eukprot:82985_1
MQIDIDQIEILQIRDTKYGICILFMCNYITYDHYYSNNDKYVHRDTFIQPMLSNNDDNVFIETMDLSLNNLVSDYKFKNEIKYIYDLNSMPSTISYLIIDNDSNNNYKTTNKKFIGERKTVQLNNVELDEHLSRKMINYSKTKIIHQKHNI